MNKLTKSALTAFGLACLSLSILPTNSAQAALLNFNLSFTEDDSRRTGAGTLQIDDSRELGSGFFEITEFQVLTPQNKSLVLSNYTPAGPDFVLGFNQTLGSIGQVNRVDPSFIFSPFVSQAPGSGLFFMRFEGRYIEDYLSSTETQGSFTASLVSPEPTSTEVPEPGVWLGSLAAMAIAYKLKSRSQRSAS